MPRVLVPPEAVQAGAVTIDRPDALRHLLRVLRVRVGDRLECFDGAGHAYAGPVVRCTPRAVVMAIEQASQEPAATVSVALAQALIKADRFAWIIQKATELGVDRVIPLETQRTVVRQAGMGPAKRDRWQRIAQEAAKQCGRATVPLIEPVRQLSAYVAELAEPTCIVMPTLAVEAPPLREIAETVRRAEGVVALIGPEGDFTADEVARAQRAGARPISLGPFTLRSETAALVTLALVQSLKGRM